MVGTPAGRLSWLRAQLCENFAAGPARRRKPRFLPAA